MKLALVGYGHLGKWHAQKSFSILGGDFCSIVESDQEKHAQIRKEFPHIKVYKKIEDVLEYVDALVLATPTKFHFQDLKKAIEAQKHVFCEKPLTNTYAETKLVREMLQKTNTTLQVGHSERFHQCWEELSDFGDIREASIFRFNRLAPYKGRGVDVDIIHDLMIHDFDLLNFLLKRLPVRVESFGKKIISDNYDYVTTILTYANGQKAFVTASRVSNFEVRGVEAVLSDGLLDIDLLNNKIYRSYFDGRENIDRSYPKRDHLFLEQDAFIKSIKTSEATVIDITDAEKVMLLIEAAQSSLVNGKPIELADLMTSDIDNGIDSKKSTEFAGTDSSSLVQDNQ